MPLTTDYLRELCPHLICHREVRDLSAIASATAEARRGDPARMDCFVVPQAGLLAMTNQDTTLRWSALTPTRWFGPDEKRVEVNPLHLVARLSSRR